MKCRFAFWNYCPGFFISSESELSTPRIHFLSTGPILKAIVHVCGAPCHSLAVAVVRWLTSVCRSVWKSQDSSALRQILPCIKEHQMVSAEVGMAPSTSAPWHRPATSVVGSVCGTVQLLNPCPAAMQVVILMRSRDRGHSACEAPSEHGEEVTIGAGGLRHFWEERDRDGLGKGYGLSALLPGLH